MSGSLDAGYPLPGKVRQAKFALPKGTKWKGLRLKAEIEVKGQRYPVRWACRQKLNEDGSLTLQANHWTGRRRHDRRYAGRATGPDTGRAMKLRLAFAILLVSAAGLVAAPDSNKQNWTNYVRIGAYGLKRRRRAANRAARAG